MRLQIQILVGSGRLERVHVDSHAVGGHNQRIFIHSAVGSGAGGQDGFLNFRAVLIGQHVRQIHHVPTGSPVGHKTLRAFHDKVGRIVGGDGGIDLIIAVGISQILHLDRNSGVSLECIGERLDGVLFPPVSNGISP